MPGEIRGQQHEKEGGKHGDQRLPERRIKEGEAPRDEMEEQKEGKNDAAAVGTSQALSQEDASIEIQPTEKDKEKSKESDLSEEPTAAQVALLKAIDEIGDDVKELASCVEVIKKSRSVKAGFQEYIAHRQRKDYYIPWLEKDPGEFNERMELFAHKLLKCIDNGTRGPIKGVRAPPFLDRKLDDEPPCGCNAAHNPNPSSWEIEGLLEGEGAEDHPV